MIKKLIIFILLFICLSLSTNALNYYIDNSVGNDANNGTSTNTPWKSEAKVSSFVGFKPGDSILFKRGQVHTVSSAGLRITSPSGTAALPITIGAYGTGADPLFSSYFAITSWISKGGNIYESTSTVPTTNTSISIVTKDNGDPIPMGRYPDYNSTNGGWASIVSAGGKDSINSHAWIRSNSTWLPTSTNWVTSTARIIIRDTRWTFSVNDITQDTTANFAIGYTTSTGEAHPIGDFFIDNDLRTLTSLYEWYYAPSTFKLSMWSDVGAPTGIKCATRLNAIVLTSKSFIHITGIDFDGFNGDAIKITGGQGNEITNCDIINSGRDAIIFNNSLRSVAKSNNITNSLNIGIEIANSNGGAASDSSTIIFNSIIRTGMIPGMSAAGVGNESAVLFRANHIRCEDNLIIDAGFCGVWMRDFDYQYVRRNLVKYSLRNLDDGGAIYIVSNRVATFNDRRFEDNILLGGNINTAAFGSKGTTSSAHGIYFDNYAGDCLVKGNYVDSFGRTGLFSHRGSRLTITENIFFNNCLSFGSLSESRGCQVYFVQDNSTNLIVNTIFTKNALITFKSYIRQIYLDNISPTLPTFTRLDSNFYYYPTTNTAPFSAEQSSSKTDYSFATWKTLLSGKETHSQVTTFVLGTDVIEAYYTTNTTRDLSSELGGYLQTDAIKNIHSGSDILNTWQGQFYIRGAVISGSTSSYNSKINHNNIIN